MDCPRKGDRHHTWTLYYTSSHNHPHILKFLSCAVVLKLTLAQHMQKNVLIKENVDVLLWSLCLCMSKQTCTKVCPRSLRLHKNANNFRYEYCTIIIRAPFWRALVVCQNGSHARMARPAGPTPLAAQF